MTTNAPLFDRLGGREPLLKLLRHFYADVRQHQVLGPIFNARIKDWPHHIEKIGDFWSTVCGGPATYNGRMGARHVPLGLKEEHFQAWLGLWEHNCRVWLAPDFAEGMITLAHQFGDRLRMITGVRPGFRPPFGLFG